MAYQIVGRAVPRLEGAEKVTGRTQYAADVNIPAALWVKILRSPVPHARLAKIDTSRASKLRGVHAVISAADLPLVLVGLRMKDMPVLARDRVRYVGEPVAAVAAETPEIADEALALIDTQYEELPVVTDPIEALRPGAPVLHENPGQYKNAPERSTELPNVQSVGMWEKGDIEAGFKKATRIFEHTFRTPLGFHAYIEPHACVVRVGDEGQVEIWASNKSPFTLRDRLAADLCLDVKKIKVHIMPVGGDFGAKTSLGEVPICYFLALKARKPVKLVHTYSEELTAAPHRHPAIITLRTGVDDDGRLCALHAKAIFSGGAYAALKANPEVTVQGPRRVASYYRIPAIQVETWCAYTNQVSCTQTRTPGSPQTVFAMESQMDIIARELGLDPVDFRMRNLLDDGDAAPFGQKWQNIFVRKTLTKAIETSGWSKSKPKNVGRGVALYERGSGGGKSGAEITVTSDGKVNILTGVPDVGPGIHTVVQQIVSETLGAAPEHIQVSVADTDSSPYDSGTGGSKSTNSVGHAGYRGACQIRDKMMTLVARRLGCKPDDIRLEKGRYLATGHKAMSFEEVARIAVEENQAPITELGLFERTHQDVTAFAAQVAEVEVDPATGQVKVRKLTTVHDAGTVLNHLTFQGQVDGGVMMGLGFALMEESPMVDGQIGTLNLGEFKIPTAQDSPRLTTVLLESPTGPVPFQGKAIAEIPNVPTAPAIANAVADAVGARIFELPLTSEKIYRALEQLKNKIKT